MRVKSNIIPCIEPLNRRYIGHPVWEFDELYEKTCTEGVGGRRGQGNVNGGKKETYELLFVIL